MDGTSESLVFAVQELTKAIHNMSNILQNSAPRMGGGGGGGPPAARGGGGGGRPPMTKDQQLGRLRQVLDQLPSLPGENAYDEQTVMGETLALTRKKFGNQNLRQVLSQADGIGLCTWAIGKAIEANGPDWSAWSDQYAASNWKLLWALSKVAYPGGQQMGQGNTTENDDVPF